MKVIMLDSIRGVGQAGDVKDVSDGYGKNFLIPRGKAKIASTSAIREAAVTRSTRAATESAQAAAEAQAMAGNLQGTTLELTGKASEKGTLFASITARDIAEGLATKTGMRLETSHIVLPEPLKSVGDHTVKIQLTNEVSATVTISILAG